MYNDLGFSRCGINMQIFFNFHLLLMHLYLFYLNNNQIKDVLINFACLYRDTVVFALKSIQARRRVSPFLNISSFLEVMKVNFLIF